MRDATASSLRRGGPRLERGRPPSGWSPSESLAWTPLLGGGAASGDLAYTVGNGAFSLDDGALTFYSKYLAIWIRDANGAWRWLLDGGNSRPAAALGPATSDPLRRD